MKRVMKAFVAVLGTLASIVAYNQGEALLAVGLEPALVSIIVSAATALGVYLLPNANSPPQPSVNVNRVN